MRKATLFPYMTLLVRTSVLLTLCYGILINSIQAQQDEDCPPLSVFCQDLHTTFMPGACMVEIWAPDFISKINDGSDMDDYIISFEKDSLVPSRIFESMFGSQYDVVIWVTDPSCDPPNQTSCIVRLDINDNTDDCPTGPCPIDVNEWCGWAVVTCTTVQETPQEFTGHVAAIVDTRKNSQAPRGDNWSKPFQQGQDIVDFIRPEAWRISNLGNIFGIAVNPLNGDIFLAASDVYDFDFQNFITVGPPPPSKFGAAGPGGIYVSNFGNPEITNVLVATTPVYPSPANFDATIIGSNVMPNTGNIADNPARSGNGIGNIDYDIRSNNIFASNLEDGKLYSINSTTGIIVDVHDPFQPYAHTPGLAPQAERIWGVAVDDCSLVSRLYFARAAKNPSNQVTIVDPKEVWSIAINPDGTFQGTERIEFIVDRGDQSKITDMGFSVQCHELLLSERGNAHSSEVTRFRKQPDNSWVFNRQFFVGIFDITNTNPDLYPNGIRGNSAAGGVTYGSTEMNCVVDADCNGLVWATVNCGDVAADDDLEPPTPFECAVYGAQGMSKSGNGFQTNKETDIFFSFDTLTVDNSIQFKSNLGDIEMYNCCCIEDEGRNIPSIAVSAMVAGEIYTEENNRVRDAQVAISSNVMAKDMMTNAQGEYLFDDLTMHDDYRVVPEKSGNTLDGISTLDMLLIQRHILGLSKLKSPYKIIAADIDNNGQISAMDMVQLRRLILGQANEEDFKSWNFVPANFKFENPKNPFPYTSDISLKDLEDNAMHEDFIAIKMGDVNGDNRFNQKSNARSARQASLNIEIINGVAHVSLDRDMRLSGLQFELAIDANTTGDVLAAGIIQPNGSNYQIEDKFIKFSWNSAQAVTISKGDILFSFETDSRPEALQLLNQTIQAKAYNDELETFDLDLNSRLINNETTLLGNSPNPFAFTTTITFDLSESQDVRFEFFNVEGKLLYTIEDSFGKGRNMLTVDAEQFNRQSNNIIIYKMNTNTESFIGKMIQITK